jgi:hypothetical protein
MSAEIPLDPFQQILELVGRIMGASPAMGTLVYDEKIYPIVAVLLEGGMLKLVAMVTEPVRPPLSGTMRVNGSDGRPIITTETELTLLPDQREPEVGSLLTFQIQAMDPRFAWPKSN